MGFYILAVVVFLVGIGLWFMSVIADGMSDTPTHGSTSWIFWIGFIMAALLVICGYFSQ